MQTVLVSRFRDSLTPGALPLVEEFDGEFRSELARSVDLVSIHHHAIEHGRYLVIEWTWDRAAEEWHQTAVINAPTLKNARQYVPPRSDLRRVPREFGLEAWVVRS